MLLWPYSKTYFCLLNDQHLKYTKWVQNNTLDLCWLINISCSLVNQNAFRSIFYFNFVNSSKYKIRLTFRWNILNLDCYSLHSHDMMWKVVILLRDLIEEKKNGSSITECKFFCWPTPLCSKVEKSVDIWHPTQISGVDYKLSNDIVVAFEQMFGSKI